MNAQQRKFLIERIQLKTRNRIDELQKTKQKFPSASNYIFKAVMNDTLELKDKEHILKAIKQKALNAKEGQNWLSTEHMGIDKESSIKLLIESLIVIPEDYAKELENVRKHNGLIDEEIKSLQMQLETIEVRVQLASDKTLQSLINEVDDMGSLSLIDTKLKLLN